jgi:hypothetical protein
MLERGIFEAQCAVPQVMLHQVPRNAFQMYR